MCGIIGYKGSQQAYPLLLQGLRNLEYRGYDSFGLCLKTEKELSLLKHVGKISDFSEQSTKESVAGIGHSRWATHGKVNEQNAHPHVSCCKSVAVVHNGIVENFQILKKELLNHGHTLESETDTELLAHLIEEQLSFGFPEAVRLAFNRIEGRNALVAIHGQDSRIIGVRSGSPLIVGVGNQDLFVASDIPAFLPHTNKVMYVDDNEMVVLDEKPLFLQTKTGDPVEKRIVEIQWDSNQAEKGSYSHYMLKEIMEQKETLMRAVNQNDEELLSVVQEMKQAKGIFFTGCGTAGKVCFTAEYLFSKIANSHVNFTPSSEFSNFRHFLTDKTLLIAISQSGETADVLDALQVAKAKQAKVLSLVNVIGSSMTRLSDYSLLIHAGPEKAVASTKATTSQLALVTLLAHAYAGKLTEGKRLLIETAGQVNDLLNPRYEQHIKKLAEKIVHENNMYILGRSANYPIALESAIKIMEVSYINAQGFAGGEMKHGPLALINKGTPCIVLVANDETKPEILSNAIEVKSRGGYIIGVSPQNNEIFDYWIKVPDAGAASPIVNIIPIQILAYYLSILRGNDPDFPKNLAKSVTVR